MTGFTYGTNDGGTYGEISGGLYGLDNNAFDINGNYIHSVSDINLSPQSVTLGFDATDANIDYWRQFDRVGDYNVNQEFGGGWQLVDDAGRLETVTLSPRNDMQPPLDKIEGYIESYTEEQNTATRYSIDITIQRLSERTNVYPAPSQSGQPWTLSFAHGDIALETKQVLQTGQRGTTSGGQWTLSLRLSDSQAGAIIDSAGVPNAVVSRNVGDETDFNVDSSSNDRQTVTINGPDGASIPDGTYLIDTWNCIKPAYGDWPWQIDLTLLEN